MQTDRSHSHICYLVLSASCFQGPDFSKALGFRVWGLGFRALQFRVQGGFILSGQLSHASCEGNGLAVAEAEGIEADSTLNPNPKQIPKPQATTPQPKRQTQKATPHLKVGL